MSDETGSKGLRTVIDEKETLVFAEIRHRDRIRAKMFNQSLDFLNDIFLGDYEWQITHTDIFALEDGSPWMINAESNGDYMLGDFDPANIRSLTHFIEQDRIKVRANSVPDDAMIQTEERATEDVKQEIASKTRFEPEEMTLINTSVTHAEDQDVDPLNTRVRIDY
jgi:hypothetical protein